MTAEQMCETIYFYWTNVKFKGYDVWKPKQIFNYSPNGELFMVFKWYNEAYNFLMTDN